MIIDMDIKSEILVTRNSFCSSSTEPVMTEEKKTEVVLYPDMFPSNRPSLEVEIQRGLKEMRQRSRKVKIAKRHARRQAKEDVPTVTKIVYPKPKKFRGCRHNNSIIIDREILSRDEHCKLLAKPRDKPKIEYPRMVRKTLPTATNHIKLLAQPKPYRVRDTINEHQNHLKPERVQRMTERLNARDYLTIQESRRFARQQRRDEKQWQMHRARQARMLKKRIVALEMSYLRDVMEKVYRQSRDYFLESLENKVDGDLEKASRIVLTRICDLIGLRVPKRDGPTDMMDEFYCEFADKLVLWIWKIMQASGITFEKPEDVERRLSGASSVFIDPNKDRENETEVLKEEVITDDETISIIRQILEGCIASTVLALHKEGNSFVYSVLTDDPRSISQAVIAAPSTETSATEREKGSKVNFMTTRLSGDVLSSVLEEKVTFSE